MPMASSPEPAEIAGGGQPLGHRLQFARAVALVPQPDHPPFARDIQSARPPRHADAWRNRVALVLVKQARRVLQAVAVGVLQLPDVPVVSEREQPSVRRVNQAVEIVQMQRQFPHGEPRHQHLYVSRRFASRGRIRVRRRFGSRYGSSGEQQNACQPNPNETIHAIRQRNCFRPLFASEMPARSTTRNEEVEPE